jgi:hypothetical protein
MLKGGGVYLNFRFWKPGRIFSLKGRMKTEGDMDCVFDFSQKHLITIPGLLLSSESIINYSLLKKHN